MIKNLYLFFVVFIAGAAVLAVEILGTRILGPFYGVSLFLWSALIAVTLIALSVGYMLGGRWADKGARLYRLCYLLLGAGIWLLLIPWFKYPLLEVSEPFGLRFAVLLVSFLLFAPPLTLLGMVSPYAIRIRALSLNEVGRTAGDLYAVSTIGSVIAALLTGFFLIPSFGVQRLLVLIGMTLIITALLGVMTSHHLKKRGTALVLIFFIIILLSWKALSGKMATDSGALMVEQSPYAEIRVVDMDNKRHLVIDGGVHTIIELNTGNSKFPYTSVLGLANYFFEQPGDMLLIGLGGGTVAKEFHREGWLVDAVEIDLVVSRVARHYFDLQPQDARIFHSDGRQFLIAHERSYDLIVMDAFGSSAIPFHLVTEEFFGLVVSRLKYKGIFAVNLEVRGWDDLVVASVAATLKQHFEWVLALPADHNPQRLGNLVLLAANHELKPWRQFHGANRSPKFTWNRHYQQQAWNYRFVPDYRNASVLSDDLNPIELWSEQINYQARKALHHYFAVGSW